VSGLYLRAALAQRGFDVELGVEAGEVLALLGPNGAGKSTALHVVAGLVAPDHGVVLAGDRSLTDTASGVAVATHDRRVGLLLQDPLLFPHLSVAANVAFSPRSRGRGKTRGRTRDGTKARMSREDARDVALHWLREVGAEEFADRRPRELSGGQAQRVAIARALAGEPDVLLLDEPMAGLDVAAATSIRAVLRRVLVSDGRCAVMATHDVLDVVALADRVAVIEDGRVAESGPAAQVLSAPRSGFGARIAGFNLVAGTVEAGGALRAKSGELWHGNAAEPLAAGRRAVAVFSPAAVAIFAEPPFGSPRNVVEVTVAEVEAHGTGVRVRAAARAGVLAGIAADVTADAAADMQLAAGARVWFAIKAQEVMLHGS
jgi:molybdate transport system ATP-binding protein